MLISWLLTHPRTDSAFLLLEQQMIQTILSPLLADLTRWILACFKCCHGRWQWIHPGKGAKNSRVVASLRKCKPEIEEATPAICICSYATIHGVHGLTGRFPDTGTLREAEKSTTCFFFPPKPQLYICLWKSFSLVFFLCTFQPQLHSNH